MAQWVRPVPGGRYGQVAKVGVLNVAYDTRPGAKSQTDDQSLSKSRDSTNVCVCVFLLALVGVGVGLGITFLPGSNSATASPPPPPSPPPPDVASPSPLSTPLSTSPPSSPPVSTSINAPVCYEPSSLTARKLVSRCELVDAQHCETSMEAAYVDEYEAINNKYRLCTTSQTDTFQYQLSDGSFTTELKFNNKQVQCFRPITPDSMNKLPGVSDYTRDTACDAHWISSTTSSLVHTQLPCNMMMKNGNWYNNENVIMLSNVQVQNDNPYDVTTCSEMHSVMSSLPDLAQEDIASLCLEAFEFPSTHPGQATRCSYNVDTQECQSPTDLHTNTCFNTLPYDKSRRTKATDPNDPNNLYEWCGFVVLSSASSGADRHKECDKHYASNHLCAYRENTVDSNSVCSDTLLPVSEGQSFDNTGSTSSSAALAHESTAFERLMIRIHNGPA